MNPIIKDFLDNGYIDEEGAERLMQKEANWADLAKAFGTKLLTTTVPTMGGIALGNMAYEYFGKRELGKRDEKSTAEIASAYRNMINTYPELKGNEQRVQQRFQEIASLSPTVAKSPIVAKKIIQRTLNEGLNEKDMGNLLRLEVNSRSLQHRPTPKTTSGLASQMFLSDLGRNVSDVFGQAYAQKMMPDSVSDGQAGAPAKVRVATDISNHGGHHPGQNFMALWSILKERNAVPSGAPQELQTNEDFKRWTDYLGKSPESINNIIKDLNMDWDQLDNSLTQRKQELYGGNVKKAAALGLQYALIKSANNKTKLDLTKTLLGLGAASLFGGAIGVAEEAADYARTKRLNNKINNSWEKTRGNLKRMTEEGNRLSSEIDYTDRKTQQKAQETFNVLADVAPNIAANSTLATSFVNNVMLNEGQFSHEFVKSLAETQKNIATMNEYRSPFADSPISSGFAKGFGGAGGTEIIKSYAQDVIKGD